jgi:hypothetical protein
LHYIVHAADLVLSKCYALTPKRAEQNSTASAI